MGAQQGEHRRGLCPSYDTASYAVALPRGVPLRRTSPEQWKTPELLPRRLPLLCVVLRNDLKRKEKVNFCREGQAPLLLCSPLLRWFYYNSFCSFCVAFLHEMRFWGLKVHITASIISCRHYPWMLPMHSQTPERLPRRLAVCCVFGMT